MTQTTRTRLLDAAERLFADGSYGATSLRMITAEAGVNLASVNYHFGSKEALLEAVLDRRIASVNRERLARLDELESGGREPSLEPTLRAFLEPPFHKMREWGDGGRKFLQLMGKVYSDTDPRIQAIFFSRFEEVLQRFTEALRRALPELRPEEVSRRMLFLIGGMAHTLAWSHKLQNLTREPEPLLEDLIQFGIAGMSAPIRSRRAGVPS